jgi:DNA-binding winged helix-turn-helix (wHTH) protein
MRYGRSTACAITCSTPRDPGNSRDRTKNDEIARERRCHLSETLVFRYVCFEAGMIFTSMGVLMERLEQFEVRLSRLERSLRRLTHMLRGEHKPPRTRQPRRKERDLTEVAIREYLGLNSDRAAKLMLILVENAGRVVTYGEVHTMLGLGGNAANSLRMIHVYVSDVRKALARANITDAIRNVTAVGYSMPEAPALQIRQMVSHHRIERISTGMLAAAEASQAQMAAIHALILPIGLVSAAIASHVAYL